MNSELHLGRCLLSCLICSAVSCADFRRGATWDDVDADDAAEEVTGDDATGDLRFSVDVHPLLIDGCQSCHEPGGAFDYVVADDPDEAYEATMRIVDLDTPGNSRLLHKTRGDGHGGGAIYARTSDEYAVILSWIQQGAVP
jgi:hypothetical protein